MKRFYSLATKEKEIFQFLTDTRCPLMNSIGMVWQPWNVKCPLQPINCSFPTGAIKRRCAQSTRVLFDKVSR